MSTVAVIDYGMGNLRSVSKALEFVSQGTLVDVTFDPDAIRRADRVILPGVGAIRDCMSELHRLELVEVLREVAASKPFLGVCLGMQAMMGLSEENDGVAGLDIIAGHVRHFGAAHKAAGVQGLKVPHMGWNEVDQVGRHPLWRGIPDRSRFYFVHGYYVEPADESVVTGRCLYGVPFCATLGRGNVFATQFHPEKSQKCGLDLLANFMHWDGTV